MLWDYFYYVRKPRNLETRRINCNGKEVRRQVSNFSSDFHCSKSIFTFLLQIIQSERLLMIKLNVKKCFNANEETFLSAYLLITEIHTCWSCGDGIRSSTKNLKKQQQQDGNPCFMFTIILVHKIIVMINDVFGCDLSQHVYFKGL